MKFRYKHFYKIWTYVLIVISVNVFLYLIHVYDYTNTIHGIKKLLQKRIELLTNYYEETKSEKDSFNITKLACLSISCSSVFIPVNLEDKDVDNKLYKKFKIDYDTFKLYSQEHYIMRKEFLNADSEKIIYIKYKDFYYKIHIETFIDILDYNQTLLVVLSNTILIIVLIFLFVYTKLNDIINKSVYNMYTENKLMKNISDILAHELVVPVNLLINYNNELGVMVKSNEKCNKGNANEMLSILEGMSFAVDRIHSVLTMFQNMEKMNNNNNNNNNGISNCNILTIVNNSITGYNYVNFNKMRFNVTHTLNYHVVPVNFSSGDILNILNILYKNAQEASSNAIEVNIQYNIETKELFLRITDNGKGIKNINDIFKYGYTTKADNKISLKDKILTVLKIKRDLYNTGRGIGLYVTKKLLSNNGGELVVERTDSTGTTFLLTIKGNPASEPMVIKK